MYRIILNGFWLIVLLLSNFSYAGQDPMRPPNWEKQIIKVPYKNDLINLQQILISKDRKIIIINNEVLQEGETINGYKIIKIYPTKIIIKRAGKNEVIRLLPDTKGENREI